MSSETKPAGASIEGKILNVVSVLGKVLLFFFKTVVIGILHVPWRNPFMYPAALLISDFVVMFAAKAWHISVIEFLLPAPLDDIIGEWIRGFGLCWNVLGFSIFSFAVILFCFGISATLRKKRYQAAVNLLGLKAGESVTPKISAIERFDKWRTKVTVFSPGIGIGQYINRKCDLQAAFGDAIERFKSGPDYKFVEIYLTKKILPELCFYKNVAFAIKNPYTFLIGEAREGILTRSLRDLPHMLIAGTTGSGKSVFFKQALLGILENSSAVQMYLLDLKNGVEVKEFGTLPNVKIAKNEEEAVAVLKAISEEMKQRFIYLERSGNKLIDPTRDKMDLIVAAVDEASVLYTTPKGNSVTKKLIEEARKLTEELAKLGRAAGVHLIFATQKVIKETIDTRIQENIGGHMCFKSNTMQGSAVVLGDRRAFDLPDIRGRAIWAVGDKFTEVQAPLLDDKELVQRCEIIAADYKEERRKNFQKMLKTEETAENDAELVTKSSASAKVTNP